MKPIKSTSRMSLQLPPTSTPSSSLPPSPGPSTLLPAVNIEPQASHHSLPRKLLLMPTVRRPRLVNAHTYSPRPARTKNHGSPRISRAKHVSVPAVTFEPEANPWDAAHWFHSECRFEVVREQLELSGFQLYAVEKWVTERTKPVTVLVVYTGDPSHKITVTALSPASNLTLRESEEEWQKGLYDLKRDGARPRETEHGTLMVTSLANFRSDYTIVHIPSGNFLDTKEQLYVNINLLRMGCSGRGALTLQDPSDTTKDRFIQTYRFPDKTLNPDVFNNTVLELVKLIQAGLGIFGMFDLSAEERNGLLCDVTVNGIKKWITDVGEPILSVEPMERVADPAMIAALFRIIVVTRNKLHNIGYNHLVPKDPFLEPQAFLSAVYALQHHGKPASPDPVGIRKDVTYLSPALLQAIDAAFEKGRQNEAYKVHKVLLNKLDDLTTDLRTVALDKNAEIGTSTGGDLLSLSDAGDLGTLVKVIQSSGKDGPASLSWLWTGKIMQLERKKKDLVSDGEDDKVVMDAKSTDEEGEFFNAMPWSNRMQKKIESWAGLHRKKQSMDMSGKTKPEISLMTDQPISGLPTVVVTDDERPGSSASSPIRAPQASAQSSFRDDDSADNVSEHDRLINEFNRQRPLAGYQSRISSWSDPFSARDMLDSEERRSRKKLKPSRLGHSITNADDDMLSSARTSAVGTPVEEVEPSGRRFWEEGRQRRHSFSAGEDYSAIRVLPVDYMRIDVELCGQLLVMRRREQHLENVVACLEMFRSALASTNRALHNQHQAYQEQFAPLEQRSLVYSDIDRQRSETEAMTQEANALSYESAQFRVADLWQLANHNRLKVFAMRSKVFGTGRRVRQGVRGAHGRYTHLQWTLDGEGRLVDQLGRTESEAEEEEGLPRVGPRLIEEEEEPDFVSNPFMKPTWLLRFFNTWRARWRAGSNNNHAESADATSPTLQSALTSPASPSSSTS